MGVSDFPNYGKKVPAIRPTRGKRKVRSKPLQFLMPMKGAKDPRDHPSHKSHRTSRDDGD